VWEKVEPFSEVFKIVVVPGKQSPKLRGFLQAFFPSENFELIGAGTLFIFTTSCNGCINSSSELLVPGTLSTEMSESKLERNFNLEASSSRRTTLSLQRWPGYSTTILQVGCLKYTSNILVSFDSLEKRNGTKYMDIVQNFHLLLFPFCTQSVFSLPHQSFCIQFGK